MSAARDLTVMPRFPNLTLVARSLGFLVGFLTLGIALSVVGPLLGLGVVAIAAVVVGLTQPRKAVVVLLPLTLLVPPIFRLSYGSLPDLTVIRCALVVVGLGLATSPLPRRPGRRGTLITLMVAFTGWTGVLLLFHQHIGAGNRAFVFTIAAFTPMALAFLAVDDDRTLWTLVDAVIAVVAAACALALWEFVTNRYLVPQVASFFFHSSRRAGHIRVQGVLPHPIVLGCVVALVLPLVVARAMSVVRRTRYVAAGAVMCAALLLTFSRGPWMAAIGGLLVFGSLLRPSRRIGVAATLIIGACLVSVLPVGGAVTAAARSAFSSDDVVGRGAANYRRMLLVRGIDQVVSEPLGLGPAGLSDLRMRAYLNGGQIDLARSVDNAYLIMAIELGMPGLGLFLAILATLLAMAYRTARRLRAEPALGPLAAALVGGQVAILIASCTVATFTWEQLSLLFWLLAGAALALDSLHAEAPVSTARSAAFSRSTLGHSAERSFNR